MLCDFYQNRELKHFFLHFGEGEGRGGGKMKRILMVSLFLLLIVPSMGMGAEIKLGVLPTQPEKKLREMYYSAGSISLKKRPVSKVTLVIPKGF